ncbi:Hypothetical protein CINCED_3A008432, partial [Cinara cedri]
MEFITLVDHSEDRNAISSGTENDLSETETETDFETETESETDESNQSDGLIQIKLMYSDESIR